MSPSKLSPGLPGKYGSAVQSDARRSTDHEGISLQSGERDSIRIAEQGRLSARRQDVGEGSRRRSKDWRDVDACQPVVRRICCRGNRRESGLVAPGDFIGKVIVSFALLDRSTEGCASLHAGVSRIGRGAKGVDGLEIAIAQVSVNVAVKIV